METLHSFVDENDKKIYFGTKQYTYSRQLQRTERNSLNVGTTKHVIKTENIIEDLGLHLSLRFVILLTIEIKKIKI